MKKPKLCPRCKKVVLDPREAMNALSRRDNETYICSQCGTEEAMFDFLIHTTKEKEKAWLAKGGSNADQKS
jgi:hypothetical protein